MLNVSYTCCTYLLVSKANKQNCGHLNMVSDIYYYSLCLQVIQLVRICFVIGSGVQSMSRQLSKLIWDGRNNQHHTGNRERSQFSFPIHPFCLSSYLQRYFLSTLSRDTHTEITTCTPWLFRVLASDRVDSLWAPARTWCSRWGGRTGGRGRCSRRPCRCGTCAARGDDGSPARDLKDERGVNCTTVEADSQGGLTLIIRESLRCYFY